MVERPLLSKDELPTSNIDKVMGVWIFRRRAQNTKIGKKWTSRFWFLFFKENEKGEFCLKPLILSRIAEAYYAKAIFTHQGHHNPCKVQHRAKWLFQPKRRVCRVYGQTAKFCTAITPLYQTILEYRTSKLVLLSFQILWYEQKALFRNAVLLISRIITDNHYCGYLPTMSKEQKQRMKQHARKARARSAYVFTRSNQTGYMGQFSKNKRKRTEVFDQ